MDIFFIDQGKVSKVLAGTHTLEGDPLPENVAKFLPLSLPEPTSEGNGGTPPPVPKIILGGGNSGGGSTAGNNGGNGITITLPGSGLQIPNMFEVPEVPAPPGFMGYMRAAPVAVTSSVGRNFVPLFAETELPKSPEIYEVGTVVTAVGVTASQRKPPSPSSAARRRAAVSSPSFWVRSVRP